MSEVPIEIFKQFQESWQKSKTEFHTSPDLSYFIVSKKWLDKWLQHLESGDDLGFQSMVNNDITINKANIIFKYDPLPTHMWNRILLPDLQEGVDFEVLNSETWRIIDNKNSCITVERDVRFESGLKIVNIYPIALNVLAIFPSTLSKFRNGKMGTLIKGDQYVSISYSLQDYCELLEATLQTVNGYHFVRKNAVRLYKCPITTTAQEVEELISNQMKDLNYYDDPSFEVKDAEYLDPKKYATIADCNIEPGQIILGDFKESQRNWCVKNAELPNEQKCENCYNFKILTHPCECKKVSYCSEECRKRDENYHLPKCEKTDSDEETMNKLVRVETSQDGKTGLRNLGNTCFMNSGIQCLSNTQPLRDFLLSNQYKDDINMDNTLGTKGELSGKFANLVRRMWYGDKTSIAPFSLKRAIGKFQPQFQGFQQHDSQELITYLLDGLNEDLCRIKHKPYVERQDYDGRPDFYIARESWDQFRQRNDSIIVDNMYGLYKSQLKCPKCAKISITFDPYLMVNVSIPQNTNKKVELQFVDPALLWDCQVVNYGYEKSADLSLGQVLADPIIAAKFNNIPQDKLIYLCTSSYQHEDTTPAEKMSSLRKKLKYKKLYIRRALPEELGIPEDEKISIFIHEAFKQYATYSWKRDITPSLNFTFKKSNTPFDLHKICFDLHLPLLKSFEGMEAFPGGDFQEYYTTHIMDKVYSLEFKTNQSWQTECSYCSAKQCSDCPIPFNTDTTLQTYLDRDAKLEVDVFIVWKRGFKLTGTPEELYNDWLKGQSKIQEEEIPDEIKAIENQPACVVAPIAANEKSLDLGECLKFSCLPEQLEEDNTWYCNVCKDHVQAYKTMQIYKVPKILQFHLKRFKSSNKYFKSKLDTQIKFPLEGLDMREYVLNHHLPQQFSTEDPENPMINKPLYYDLYAVSNHFGGLGGGHYTAYGKNFHDNEWYHFDDSFVSKVKAEEAENSIVSSAAYILFYRLRD